MSKVSTSMGSDKASVVTYVRRKLKSDPEWLVKAIEDALFQQYVPGEMLRFDVEDGKGDYPIRDSSISEVVTAFTVSNWNITITRDTADVHLLHIEMF